MGATTHRPMKLSYVANTFKSIYNEEQKVGSEKGSGENKALKTLKIEDEEPPSLYLVSRCRIAIY